MKKFIYLIIIVFGINTIQMSAQNVEFNRMITYRSYISFKTPTSFKSSLYCNDTISYFDFIPKDKSSYNIDEYDATFEFKIATKHGNFVYNNIRNSDVISGEMVFNKGFVVKEETPLIEWDITNEAKNINEKIICYKATCNFRGRKYTAWFCPEIPTSLGPWKLFGLPGLIFDVYDENNEVKFTLEKIEDVKKVVKLPLEEYEIISWQEYSKTLQQKMDRFKSFMQTTTGTGYVDVNITKINSIEKTLFDD